LTGTRPAFHGARKRALSTTDRVHESYCLSFDGSMRMLHHRFKLAGRHGKTILADIDFGGAERALGAPLHSKPKVRSSGNEEYGRQAGPSSSLTMSDFIAGHQRNHFAELKPSRCPECRRLQHPRSLIKERPSHPPPGPAPRCQNIFPCRFHRGIKHSSRRPPFLILLQRIHSRLKYERRGAATM